MGAGDLTRLVEELLAAPTWDDMVTLVESHPELLTPAADQPFAYLVDAARRDSDDARVTELTTLEEMLRSARGLGPKAAAAALRGGGAQPEPSDAGYEFWEIYRSTGDPAFLDSAVEQWELGLTRYPPGSEGRPAALNNVATGCMARYQLSQAPDDLSRALETSGEALEATPPGTPERATRLSNWAGAVLARFHDSGDVADLDAALSQLESAAAAAPPGSAERALCLHNYGAALYARYARLGESDDLNAMIDAAREAVQLTPPGTRDYSERQNGLAVALERAYLDQGNGPALDAALDAWHEALYNDDPRAPKQLDVVFAYGRGLWRRHEVSGRLDDWTAAIELLCMAHMYGHPDAFPLAQSLLRRAEPADGVFPPELTPLVNRITSEMTRFEATREYGPIDAVIRGWNVVLEHPALTGPVSSWRAAAFSDVGHAFLERFQTFAIEDDLLSAVACFEEAVKATPEGSPQIVPNQSNLAVALIARFERDGDGASLRRAREFLEGLLALDPPPGPDRAAAKANLAKALLLGSSGTADRRRAGELLDEAIAESPEDSPDLARLRANRASLGEPEGLDATVSDLEELVRTAPAAGPQRVQVLGQLGQKLLERYEAHGDLGDLDRAVSMLERAADAAGHSAVAGGVLAVLGLARMYRGALFDRLSESERAVDALTESVAATPAVSPDYDERSGLLGAALLSRANRRGDLEERTRAIEMLREALDHLPPESDRRPLILQAYGEGLRARNRETDDTDDLDESIDALTEVADGAPADSGSHGALVTALLMRYDRDGGRDDLQRAVAILEASLPAEQESRERARMLTTLGEALVRRFRLDANAHDRERAAACFRSACDLAADPGLVLHAARGWAGLEAGEKSWQEAAEPYQLGLDALARLLGEAALRADKTVWLKDARGFAADAAFGLSLAQDREGAVVALERNRALLLTETLERERLDVERLRALGHADLADDYERASDRLRAIEAAELSGDPAIPRPARSRLADDFRAAHTALDLAVEKIRAVSGYEGLFAAAGFGDVVRLAGGSPVVYLTAASEWGTAFVANAAAPPPIMLPHLSTGQVAACAREYLAAYAARAERPDAWRAELEQATGWLWQVAIGPVLDAFAGPFGDVYLGERKAEGVPEIVLVPVGALALLPLHAAWTPDKRPGSRRYALDEIRIRYAPNVRTFAEARRVAEATVERRFFAVDEPLPVTAGRLPGAGAEVAAAVAAFPGGATLRHEEATKEAVVERLGDCTVAHLACHGQADARDPLDSFLLLAGDERLSLREIMAQRLPGIRLVVLSACETALVGQELPDEVVGLPAGLLQAGAGGVVASLWSVPDASTALLLTRFYELWQKRQEDPAEALRLAQKWVRDSSNGEKLVAMPELMAARAERVPARARRLWEGAHGHRHPYHWAGFAYVGA